ncbi:HAD-IA family hydrolase [Azospira restricta]|uniref:phosphoglycolate phosphatase n=1 Tax=Azospira restricta TaxID=404405 RepID=A0A974PW92_9RHOO|nr:HAD-IA family hydrolase [Azospira restricta]QRJ62135.1 HAD-IA family hydrolase [Azospira restricta]
MPDLRPQAVLFDLDGTFADTAPDLGAALNALRAELGLAPVDLSVLRPYTSQGVRGMLGAGLGLRPDHPDYPGLHRRFLGHYQQALCVHTRLFDGIAALVDTVERQQLRWGIVTNKSQRFTLPLMHQLGYARRAACLVSGDSSPRTKPHPQPMRLACAVAGCAPERALYVGDDRRDIDAGRAAGMVTVAVRYGYLGDSGPIEEWGADHLVDHPDAIAALLNG